jgi:diphthine-ammonia ligase
MFYSNDRLLFGCGRTGKYGCEGVGMVTKKAFCCWSGGKDCAMALYREKLSGGEVPYLLNMASADGKYSCSHGIGSELIRRQAASAGLCLVQGKTTFGSYETEFKKQVQQLREHGVNTGVYGDIDLMEHRQWIERVARESEIEPVFPLWETNRREFMDEFIAAGFKAVICSINTHFLGEEWLGREIDRDFVSDIEKHGGIDLCGEKGEYHTFVYDGPLFKKPVQFATGAKTIRENHFFLELI